MEALEPLVAIRDLDPEAVIANRYEAAALAARELRFFGWADELFTRASDAWLACRGEGNVSVLRVRLAQLEVRHEAVLLEGFGEELAELRADLLEAGGERQRIALGADYLDACLALDARRFVDAEALAWNLLREQSEFLGPYHLDTLKTSWLMGRTLMWQGRASAASKHLERARDGYQRALGPLHPDTLECQVDLAVSLASTRCSDARDLLALSQEKLSLILGEEHASTLHARVYHDHLLLKQGKTRGLEERFDRSLVLCRARLGEDHDLTQLCRRVQGQLDTASEHAYAREASGPDATLADRAKQP